MYCGQLKRPLCQRVPKSSILRNSEKALYYQERKRRRMEEDVLYKTRWEGIVKVGFPGGGILYAGHV
jgi:hypothetical protein